MYLVDSVTFSWKYFVELDDEVEHMCPDKVTENIAHGSSFVDFFHTKYFSSAKDKLLFF